MFPSSYHSPNNDTSSPPLTGIQPCEDGIRVTVLKSNGASSIFDSLHSYVRAMRKHGVVSVPLEVVIDPQTMIYHNK